VRVGGEGNVIPPYWRAPASFERMLRCSAPPAQQPNNHTGPDARPESHTHQDVPVLDLLGTKGHAVEVTNADGPGDPYAEHTIREKRNWEGERQAEQQRPALRRADRPNQEEDGKTE
jgi:hypothetical protein